MQVDRVRALRGPNLWTRRTAIEAIVSCDDTERDLSQFSGFEERLRALYPRLQSLASPPEGSTNGLAQVLEVATLILQSDIGCPVTFSRTAAAPDPGVYQVVVEYDE